MDSMSKVSSNHEEVESDEDEDVEVYSQVTLYLDELA